MKRVALVASFALLAMALPASALARGSNDAALKAPPAGIVPTQGTIAQILAANRTAVGRLPAGTPNTRHEVWKFTEAGFAGSETLTRSGLDYHSHIVEGPFAEDFGQSGETRWHQDYNGITSPKKGAEAESFLMFRVLDDAADPKNDVKLLGEVAQPKPCYVIEVHRSGETYPEWIFYDKQTGLIDRTESVDDGKRVVNTYDDYRATDGLTQPWHVHDSDGRAVLDDDYQRESLTIGDPVTAAEFAAPADRRMLDTFSGHVTLPAKMVDASVVVRLMINGRGLDFELSSGQPFSLIDSNVAHELSLQTYGQLTQIPHGDSVAYQTIIPHAQLGGLTLDNLVVESLPFYYNLNGETKIVGMLGSDVLSQAVFKIDYVNQTVDLYDAKDFDGNAPVPGAITIPVTLDDKMPFFNALIASQHIENVLLDNAFDFSMTFGSFNQRYPDAMKDLTGGSDVLAEVPFADNTQLGREFSVWVAKAPDLIFGSANFRGARLVATNAPASVNGHDIDAVFGQDLLDVYDVYFDYPHHRVLLKPNSYFSKLFHPAHA